MKLQIQLQPEGANSSSQQFEIPFQGDALVIGRGPESPVPLEGAKLSRNHLSFGLTNGTLTVTDLSSNGVWVNAQPLPKKTAIGLRGTEEISIPGYRMRVALMVPPAAPVEANAVSPRVAQPEVPSPAATAVDRKPASTSETISDADPAPEREEAGPPWWALSGLERFVLLMVAIVAAIFAYYYSLR